ncbi:NlpC/P60 family protein [Nocardia panacis]|uniref:NlpC/P60 family protein n=1 Tax=Nocardia panacis TaxID=2340916 RepID=A0A3A4K6H8_9NOCA|nr:NlpC/P60 family protein [Nocardia panacis]RJO68259.1 NlpC/P60 family protein [Nocardia panacis]
MRNNGEVGTRRPALVALGLLISVAIVLTAAQAGAVPPPPPNPSDGQLSDAGAQVDAGVAEVGGLINQVASAEQQLQQLDEAVALKREAVNKALVDLQDARDASERAAASVTDSERELAEATTKVGQARSNFDVFAARAYTKPATPTMITFLAAASPDTVLDRARVLAMVSKQQQQVLDGLRRAQITRGNLNSLARQAKSEADAAAAAAEAKKADAEQAVAAAKVEADRQAGARDTLVKQRQGAQTKLDAARQNVAGLVAQRDAYLAWDQRRRAEEAAIRAAAQAAAARAAADQAARDRAAKAAEGKRPHTDLRDEAPQGVHPQAKPKRDPAPTMPAIGGSDAVETVVDRAMSQLGVQYSWGGGDENGPTLGIHDGGVADSYGDYNKVGFDCSGLMIYAFAGIGVSLPHYSGYQYNAGTRVPVAERVRGDMLFWGPNGSEHVALYLGNGQMVEAPQSGEVVKVSAVRNGGIMPYAVRIIT